MCKILRNKKLLFILCRQIHAIPLPIGGRTFSDVHSHIIDLSAHHTHQFILGIVNLEMQAAQHALSGTGLVVLYKFLGDSCLFIIVVIIGFHKISAFISENRRCNHFQTFNITCLYRNFSHLFSSFSLLINIFSVQHIFQISSILILFI